MSWPVWLDVVGVTFTLEAKRAQIQEPAAEGENPVKDWSWFPLAMKELLQTFLWPGVEFRSLAWPLLPQPSSLSCLSVPKLPCPGSCAAPGLTAWQGLPLAWSQLGWLGSAGSRSVEGSGRSDSIPKSGKWELQDRNALDGFSFSWEALGFLFSFSLTAALSHSLVVAQGVRISLILLRDPRRRVNGGTKG